MTSWNDILAEEIMSVKVFSEILAQAKYYENHNRDYTKVATQEMQSEIAFTKDYLCIHICYGVRKDKIKAFSEISGFEELEKTLSAMRNIIQSAEMYHKITFETIDSLPHSESHRNIKLLEEEEIFLTAHNDLKTSRRNIVLDIDPFEVAHWLSTTPKGLQFLPQTLLNTLNEHEQNVTPPQDPASPQNEQEETKQNNRTGSSRSPHHAKTMEYCFSLLAECTRKIKKDAFLRLLKNNMEQDGHNFNSSAFRAFWGKDMPDDKKYKPGEK